MHIPSEMLHGAVCPVTAGLSSFAVGAAGIASLRIKEKPSAAQFGAVSALIFAAQMINFPIQNGTSGHLMGAVLAGALLGLAPGILAMALVLTVQCLVFSDGGLSVLGANILNMAVAAPLAGALIRFGLKDQFSKKLFSQAVILSFASWVSVMTAAFFCSVELSASGVFSFSKIAGSMLGVHARIGIGEGILTGILYAAFASLKQPAGTATQKGTAPFLAAFVTALMLSPFASGFPDGLEWVAQKYQLFHAHAPAFSGLMADYTVPFISAPAVSTAAAGSFGVLLVFAAAWSLAKGLQFKKI